MATDAEIESSVIVQLASSDRYACSTITRLNGGTANFVYQGILSTPGSGLDKDDSGAEKKNVIIKHTQDFVALSRDFKLDAERCVFEAEILNALNSFSPVRGSTLSSPPATITVRTPKLYHFLAKEHTQIMEDLPESADMKTWLLSTGENIDKQTTKAIGHALGSWISSFHSWSSLDEQSELRNTLAKNESMQKLKYSVNYDRLVDRIDRHPHILEGSRSVFEQVRAHAAKEISGSHNDSNWGLIHGDFWTGNVLMTDHTMFIIDWELSQLGMRALDLGQMLAELYETKLFKGIDAGVWIIEGIMENYVQLNEDIAFRTAVHMGVHLVCWSDVPGWGEESQIEDVVRMGRDLAVKGWERDRGWFERHDVLKCLFR